MAILEILWYLGISANHVHVMATSTSLLWKTARGFRANVSSVLEIRKVLVVKDARKASTEMLYATTAKVSRLSIASTFI